MVEDHPGPGDRVSELRQALAVREDDEGAAMRCALVLDDLNLACKITGVDGQRNACNAARCRSAQKEDRRGDVLDLQVQLDYRVPLFFFQFNGRLAHRAPGTVHQDVEAVQLRRIRKSIRDRPRNVS